MNDQDGGLALYPGTFDPFTFGHLDIVERAVHLFEHIEITVASNREKQPLFDTEKRIELIEASVSNLENVTVAPFDGLLVDYARKRGALALVRGLRQVSDFDFEFRMAFANRRLNSEIETVFLMTSEEHALISSSIVREIHFWGGDTSTFVPPAVQTALEENRS